MTNPKPYNCEQVTAAEAAQKEAERLAQERLECSRKAEAEALQARGERESLHRQLEAAKEEAITARKELGAQKEHGAAKDGEVDALRSKVQSQGFRVSLGLRVTAVFKNLNPTTHLTTLN